MGDLLYFSKYFFGGIALDAKPPAGEGGHVFHVVPETPFIGSLQIPQICVISTTWMVACMFFFFFLGGGVPRITRSNQMFGGHTSAPNFGWEGLDPGLP